MTIYFRVVRTEQRDGEVNFTVQRANGFFGKFIGDWMHYNKEHDALEDAIDHVQSLIGYIPKETTVIWEHKEK